MTQQKVPTKEAEEYARSIGAIFRETSAKTDKCVQDVFVDISRKLPSEGELEDDDDGEGTVDVRKAPKKSGGCC